MLILSVVSCYYSEFETVALLEKQILNLHDQKIET